MNQNDVLSQAWMPSTHVWATFALSASPQLLNQAPPRAQQLRLLDFFSIPHFAHAELTNADDGATRDGIAVPDFTNVGQKSHVR